MKKSKTLGLLLLLTSMTLTACYDNSSGGDSSGGNNSPGGDSSGGDNSGGDNSGGDTSTPSTPTIASNFTLTPKATKTLQFTWDDGTEETEYRLLENADGMSGFSKVATIPADAQSYEHTISLSSRINAQYILQSCNTEGCLDSDTISVSSNLAKAIGYFKASNTDADDNFGTAVSLSADGNTLAVGAYYEDSNATGINGDQDGNNASASGAVYLFTRNDTGWSQQAYIKASNTETNDKFGTAVSLSADGNTLAVGADGEGSNATGGESDNSAFQSGAVYLFTRSDSDWSQQAYIKASNTDTGDYFGTAVSLSADGNTLAVGADGEASNATGGESDNSATQSGAVYLFTRNNTTWSQQAYIKASNTGEYDRFGTALSLSADGNTLAVGAHFEDSNATGIKGDESNNDASGSGAVYLFTRNNTNWSQQAYIKASNTDPSDNFGTAVSLSADGNTLAVGANKEDSNTTGINGNESNNDASFSGAVYLFTRNNSDWSQQAYIKASNTDASNYFGQAVSLSADGNTLAVGAYLEDSNATGINGDQSDNSASSGAVYLFTRSNSEWSQQAYIKASNTDADDEFGSAVSLSEDGSTLAVGANKEDSSAKGINNDQTNNTSGASGAVYLY